jgi:hypothetical protein
MLTWEFTQAPSIQPGVSGEADEQVSHPLLGLLVQELWAGRIPMENSGSIISDSYSTLSMHEWPQYMQLFTISEAQIEAKHI